MLLMIIQDRNLTSSKTAKKKAILRNFSPKLRPAFNAIHTHTLFNIQQKYTPGGFYLHP